VTGASVTRIVLEGGRASGVEFRVGRQARRVNARREVLLSAGALQSPQLLLLSGIGSGTALQALGVPVRHDLPGVGRHLHDHVSVTQIISAPRRTDTFTVSPSGAPRVVKGAWDWGTRRTGVLTSNIAEAGAFIRSDADAPRPDLQIHLVITKLIDHARQLPVGHGYTCHLCPLRPQSRGSVRLASADPAAPPLIDPNFFGEPNDMDLMIRGFKRLRHILQQPALATHGGREVPALAAAQTDAQIEAYIRAHSDTEYHPVGSCRMGPDPQHDVVDAQLRVHGVAGLRVVDASIMPRIVSGNTNAPVVMIAEKAVDLIRDAARRAA
jgi:choline dehydrogenase-like flavoprotein